jgi:hypothetical protein
MLKVRQPITGLNQISDLLERSRPARIVSLTLVIGATFLVYRNSFEGFFAQDDFGWLIDSRFQSWRDLVNCFFRFNPAMTYRPLSQEVFFWLGQNLFGLWPPGFHAFSMFFHLAGGVLLYQLLRQFVAPLPALLGMAFYLIHSAHLSSVYWISAIPEPMALICYLAAVLFFIKWDRRHGRHCYALSLVAMGVGMMCKESILTVPLVLAAYCFLYNARRIWWTIPFFAISGFYALCRASSIAVSAAPYTLSLNDAWNNLSKYITWSCGFSDTFVLHIARWSPTTTMHTVSSIFLLGLIAGLFWIIDKRLMLFSLVWYFSALQPVLYFSQHIYPYYLAPSLAGLALLLAAIAGQLMKSKPRTGLLIPAVALISFVLICATSIKFEGRWWNERSFIAREVLEKLKEVDRQFPKNRIAYIFGFDSNDFGVMQDDAAIKCYGFSPQRFILMGLDGSTPSQITALKKNGGLRNYYCFLYSEGDFINVTAAFRSDPTPYLNLLSADPEPQFFSDTSEVRLESSRTEYIAGRDTLVLYVRNFPKNAVDLLYTLNGGSLQVSNNWRLDSSKAAQVRIGPDTQKGMYHFIGIRESVQGEQGHWFKIDLEVKIK